MSMNCEILMGGLNDLFKIGSLYDRQVQSQVGWYQMG